MMKRFLLGMAGLAGLGFAAEAIDREALVRRHNPVIRTVDVDAPVMVGNGNFAFGFDVTGLQTFAERYHQWGVPTEMQSRWAWVESPNTEGFTLADASRDYTLADGRVMAFPTLQTSEAGDWLRKNPRVLPLGEVSFEWEREDGGPPVPGDVKEAEQVLDLWSGVVKSSFKLGDGEVSVTTAGHAERDLVAVRVKSGLLEGGKLRVGIAFPRGHDLAVKNTPGLDWTQPESHRTELVRRGEGRVDFERTVEGTRYRMGLAWKGGAELKELGGHRFELSGGGEELEFVVELSPEEVAAELPAVDEVLASSAAGWERFWKEGGVADFSGSTNPLARKVEERIILSRYQMAVQMAGDVPPQESGLTCATWYGKHHSEMIWWHAAHFALWGHDRLLERNLDWYRTQLPAARKLAAERGLKGARWAKMTGPEMRESPGGNPLIMWNQPHMIYLSELLHRNDPSPELLAKYRELVLETAECMASMLHLDEARGEMVLGPPLWIVQEIHDPAGSQNPSFELAYWRWGLETAQVWRERLGMGRNEDWDLVVKRLPPLPMEGGKYVALESFPDTWTNPDSRHDHPAMLMPLGFLPGGPDVDRVVMGRTLDAVLAEWDWETKIWGWDYPMIAMTAARLGRADTAVEILMREGPNNLYLPTGHCPQRSDEKMSAAPEPGARKREIAAYLPANGSFLAAVALMVAGWDGSEGMFPGFPKDGSWKIRSEGIRPSP